jgi:hypothetical protein
VRSTRPTGILTEGMLGAAPSPPDDLSSEPALIPGGSLITPTAEDGHALAPTIARHTIHNIQQHLDLLKGGRPNSATTPVSLIVASQVVAIEFQTIAAANNHLPLSRRASRHILRDSGGLFENPIQDRIPSVPEALPLGINALVQSEEGRVYILESVASYGAASCRFEFGKENRKSSW